MERRVDVIRAADHSTGEQPYNHPFAGLSGGLCDARDLERRTGAHTIATMRINTVGQFGPLQPNFTLEIPRGYQVLLGPNNVGKTAILQWAFAISFDEGADAVALLTADRTHVLSTTEPGGRSLALYNDQLVQQIRAGLLSHETTTGPPRNEIFRLLVNHTDFQDQLNRLVGFVERLGLPRPRLRDAQNVHFDEIAVAFQGSGLRSALTILSALTDTRLKVICIDEPEMSLEPVLQKALRDLLIEESSGRTILVATHSHLFLNRQQRDANWVVTGHPGAVRAEQVTSDEQLHDLVFRLLGNSTEDLFFPGNYLVVEGASDQALCERVARLEAIPADRVKVLSAGGVASVLPATKALVHALRPLTVGDSPYAGRVVALVDSPATGKESTIAPLRETLGDRLFVLTEASLEAYVPEELYARAGRSKADDLEALATAKSDYLRQREVKRDIVEAVAGVLTVEDLETIPVIVEAVRRAAEASPAQEARGS